MNKGHYFKIALGTTTAATLALAWLAYLGHVDTIGFTIVIAIMVVSMMVVAKVANGVFDDKLDDLRRRTRRLSNANNELIANNIELSKVVQGLRRAVEILEIEQAGGRPTRRAPTDFPKIDLRDQEEIETFNT